MHHTPRNVLIHSGGDVTIMGGTFVQNIHDDSGKGALQYLLENSAPDAMARAVERFPQPRCMEGTRTEILEELDLWLNHPIARKRVSWIHGTVGVGKSAIMQTIAEVHSSLISASFFFGRGRGRRGHGQYLFPTLAYQLAVNVPGLRDLICEVVHHNPSVLHQDLSQQFDALIATPLSTLSLTQDDRSPILLIDGLDECEDLDTQQLIAQICTAFALEHPYLLRFIFASRPEVHIVEVFDDPDVSRVTHKLDVIPHNMPARSNPWPDALKVLRAGFGRIYTSKRLAKYGVPQPWPPLHVQQRLANMSSGQMVFIDMVLKVVGDRYADPRDQLELVLDAQGRAESMSNLDALYTQILSVYPDKKKLSRFLSFILQSLESFRFPPAVVEGLLGWRSGEIQGLLAALSSVIDVDRQTDAFRLAHYSFSEFLQDKVRSGPYYVDFQQAKFDLIIQLTHHASEQILLDLQSSPQTATTATKGQPLLRSDVVAHIGDTYLGRQLYEWCQGFNIDLQNQLFEELEVISNRFASLSSSPSTKRPLKTVANLKDTSIALIHVIFDFLLVFRSGRSPNRNQQAILSAKRLMELAKPYRSVYHAYLDEIWDRPGSLADLLRILPRFPLFGADRMDGMGHCRTPAQLGILSAGFVASTNPTAPFSMTLWDETLERNKRFLRLHPRRPRLVVDVLEYYVLSGRVEGSPCCLDTLAFENIEILAKRWIAVARDPPPSTGIDGTSTAAEEDALIPSADLLVFYFVQVSLQVQNALYHRSWSRISGTKASKTTASDEDDGNDTDDQTYENFPRGLDACNRWANHVESHLLSLLSLIQSDNARLPPFEDVVLKWYTPDRRTQDKNRMFAVLQGIVVTCAVFLDAETKGVRHPSMIKGRSGRHSRGDGVNAGDGQPALEGEKGDGGGRVTVRRISALCRSLLSAIWKKLLGASITSTPGDSDEGPQLALAITPRLLQTLFGAQFQGCSLNLGIGTLTNSLNSPECLWHKTAPKRQGGLLEKIQAVLALESATAGLGVEEALRRKRVVEDSVLHIVVRVIDCSTRHAPFHAVLVDALKELFVGGVVFEDGATFELLQQSLRALVSHINDG